jgi:hypothetical protein
MTIEQETGFPYLIFQDVLFQKNSIAQLKILLKKIQDNANKKTTDLRYMVGYYNKE